MKFKVTYLDDKNNKFNKIVEYDNENILIEDFKSQNYKLIRIDCIKNKNVNTNINKLKEDDVSEFLKQFSILLRSGIDIKNAIVALKEQESNVKLRKALNSIEENINLGNTLSDSFKKTGSFPPLIIGIIETGEISSNLSKSLEILSDYYEHEKKIKQSMKNALYYPIILLIVTFVIVIGIVAFVLPRYINFFETYENLELPFMTKALINISQFFQRYNILLLIIILFVTVIGKIFISNKKINYHISKKILRLPFLGKYLLNLEMLRLSGIMQILLDSGIDLLKILEVSSKSLKNSYLKVKVEESKSSILRGTSLYGSLIKIDILPSMFLNLVNVGEWSSNLSETMAIAFEYYQNLVAHQGKKLTSLFEPLIIIFVSLIVGSVVMAIALPTFNLVNII